VYYILTFRAVFFDLEIMESNDDEGVTDNCKKKEEEKEITEHS